MSKPIDVVVVGGGQAGLAASHFLTLRGIENVVIERGRVGETWRSQRWDSFALNTPRWMSQMPGEPEDDGDRDAFLSAPAWVGRLEASVARQRLPVREEVLVKVVRPRPAGGFDVQVEGPGGAEALGARAVIVASGTHNVPRIPSWAHALPSDVLQLTAGSYRRPADLPPGGVLVVGGAQSGVQIAEDLVLAGREVHLATSSVGRLRRRYRGRDSLEWLVLAGFWDRTPDQLSDPRMLTWPNPQLSGVGPQGHTVGLQSLAAMGVRLLGRPTSADAGRIVLEDTLGASIAFADRLAVDLIATADHAIAEAGIDAPPAEPDPADMPHPDPTSVHSPTEIDLPRAGISTIIWTTGFGGDFGYLPPGALDAAGHPVHDGLRSALPGLYYLGFPWLVKRKSGIIHGLAEDGAAVVGLIAQGLGRG